MMLTLVLILKRSLALICGVIRMAVLFLANSEDIEKMQQVPVLVIRGTTYSRLEKGKTLDDDDNDNIFFH